MCELDDPSCEWVHQLQQRMEKCEMLVDKNKDLSMEIELLRSELISRPRLRLRICPGSWGTHFSDDRRFVWFGFDRDPKMTHPFDNDIDPTDRSDSYDIPSQYAFESFQALDSAHWNAIVFVSDTELGIQFEFLGHFPWPSYVRERAHTFTGTGAAGYYQPKITIKFEAGTIVCDFVNTIRGHAQLQSELEWIATHTQEALPIYDKISYEFKQGSGSHCIMLITWRNFLNMDEVNYDESLFDQ